MKYVFYNVKVYAGMPRYTEDVTAFLVRSVGSEILANLMPAYLGRLRKMVEDIIPRKVVTVGVQSSVYNTDKRRHGEITVYKKVKDGVDVVAILNFVEVSEMWLQDIKKDGEITQMSIRDFEKMKLEYSQREEGGQK